MSKLDKFREYVRVQPVRRGDNISSINLTYDGYIVAWAELAYGPDGVRWCIRTVEGDKLCDVVDIAHMERTFTDWVDEFETQVQSCA